MKNWKDIWDGIVAWCVIKIIFSIVVVIVLAGLLVTACDIVRRHWKQFAFFVVPFALIAVMLSIWLNLPRNIVLTTLPYILSILLYVIVLCVVFFRRQIFTFNVTTKILIPMLGGVTALIGFGAIYMQFQTQTDSIKKQNSAEQFKIAIEHLGSEKQTIVLGGVHALHNLALNYKDEYSQPVFEVLCSFIREETRKREYQARVLAEIKKNEKVSAEIGDNASDAFDTSDKPDSTQKGTSLVVIQTIVDKLFREEKSNDLYQNYTVNLNGAFLRGVDWSIKNGKLNWPKANLQNVDMQGANLFLANLQGADLSGADLQGASLQDANLRGANLENTIRKDANFSGTIFQRTDL